MKPLIKLAILLVLVTPGLAQAKEAYTSEFIENLPALEANSEDSNLLEWTKSGLNAGGYSQLFIPQPYLFLSEDNKYKGIQPDQMKLLADRVDAIFSSRFEDIIELVDGPGPGVIVMNLAVTGLKMKKKRGLMGFTPAGALMHAATSNSKIEDLEKLAKKVTLSEANLEVEFVDGRTGELLAVRVLVVSHKEKGAESWQAVRKEISDLADRFYNNYSASLLAM